MIKHSIKDDTLLISINKKDFSYRIPVKKIGNSTDWIVGDQSKKGIVIKNVSSWTLQLFTKKVTEEKYIKQFVSIIQELSTDNSINWESTLFAVEVQNKYNWMVSSNKASVEKLSEEEIISKLIEKYQITSTI